MQAVTKLPRPQTDIETDRGIHSAVAIERAQHTDAAAQAGALSGRDVTFGAADNRLAFLTTDLDAVVRSSDPALLEVFERQANAVPFEARRRRR